MRSYPQLFTQMGVRQEIIDDMWKYSNLSRNEVACVANDLTRSFNRDPRSIKVRTPPLINLRYVPDQRSSIYGLSDLCGCDNSVESFDINDIKNIESDDAEVVEHFRPIVNRRTKREHRKERKIRENYIYTYPNSHFSRRLISYINKARYNDPTENDGVNIGPVNVSNLSDSIIVPKITSSYKSFGVSGGV